jgi:hypothetical protein
LNNSIVDAGAATALAYTSPGEDEAGAPLVAIDCTIIGRVQTLMIELASNTIFLAETTGGAPPVQAEKLQEGCVRFSYVPPGARVPHRFGCQPGEGEDPIPMRPVFTSLRYGEAGYGQLAAQCHRLIKEGADDGAEMGAFHDLYQPQRQANLRARLDEFLRFGLQAGIFTAS